MFLSFSKERRLPFALVQTNPTVAALAVNIGSGLAEIRRKPTREVLASKFRSILSAS